MVKTKTYKEQAFDHLRGLNGLNGDLAEMRGQGKASGTNPEFAELTRRLGLEYNGMILHEY